MWVTRCWLSALLLAWAAGGATAGAADTTAAAAFDQLNASEGEVLAFINGLDGQVVLLGQPQYPKARNFTFATGERLVSAFMGIPMGHLQEASGQTQQSLPPMAHPQASPSTTSAPP